MAMLDGLGFNSRRRRLANAASTMLLSLAAIAPPAWSAPPIEAYGRLPQFEDAVLSPAGDRVAYVLTVENRREVVVQTFGADKKAIRIDAGENIVHNLAWMGNNFLTITASRISDFDLGRQFNYGATQIYDFTDQSLHALPQWLERRGMANAASMLIGPARAEVIRGEKPGTAGAAPMLESPPEMRFVDGHTYAFLRTRKFVSSDRGWVPALFRVALESERKDQANLVQLGPGSAGLTRVLIDAGGEPVAEASYHDRDRRWLLEIQHDGHWIDAQTQETELDQPYILGFAPEDGWGLMRMPGGSVRRFSLEDGHWGEPLESAAGFNLFLTDPLSHKIIGGEQLDLTRHYRFFDPAAQVAWDKIMEAFPGEDVRLQSWSDNRQKIIVRVFGTHTGAAYALIDRDSNQISLMGNFYKDIAAQDIAPVQTLAYAAADGLKIPAYLTLPLARPAKNLPLIVLPHSAPAERDTPGFDWYAQALASRGYAVLQANFRGSGGFGAKFLEAGYGQWGRKMQSDLSDGVRYLAGQGLIDPQRVCIVGRGYGGYAALAGATLDTGVYRCAAAISAISDLKGFVQWRNEFKKRSDDHETRYWTRFMGAENASDPVLDTLSPLKHAGQAAIPVLLIHGKDDTFVPQEQSLEMAEALKKAGKPYELVELPGEDYWLSRADTRIQMLQTVIKFLEKNNPP